uniref:Transposase n=1 Tax=Cacopsylla melanoneura TaxID=428564 RepID=A0A8D8W236_9HEMI
METLAELACQWLMRPPPRQTFCQNELNLSSKTIVDWLSFFMEITFDWALKNSSEKLGGEGVIVEIDEGKFGRRKYNVGRVIDGQWIFGGIERNPKKFFLVPVPVRVCERQCYPLGCY